MLGDLGLQVLVCLQCTILCGGIEVFGCVSKCNVQRALHIIMMKSHIHGEKAIAIAMKKGIIVLSFILSNCVKVIRIKNNFLKNTFISGLVKSLLCREELQCLCLDGEKYTLPMSSGWRNNSHHVQAAESAVPDHNMRWDLGY